MKIENGICYLSSEDDGVSRNDEIRKIIIPEGISVLGPSSIHDLPNLEEIEFPSTLKVISNSAITYCPKLAIKGLKFKSNKFYMEAINSIRPSKNSTFMEDYYKKITALICSEETTFEDKCDLYNQVLLTMREEVQLEFTKLFLSQLSESDYNLLPIINKIKDGKTLNCADLQLFCICLQKNMNLPIHPMVFIPYSQNLACARINGIVSVGYISLLWAAERKMSNIQDMSETAMINIFLLYAISHEFQHIRQRKSAESANFDSMNILNQLDYIDSEIQSTCDTYEKGYNYSGFHDSSPDEIRADLDGYDMLTNIISSLDNFELKSKILELLEKRKLARIKEAHQIDESGNVNVYDYRLRAFEELLSRDNLSDSERKKLNRLKALYLGVLEKANGLGIDLFSDELNYFKSKSESSEFNRK